MSEPKYKKFTRLELATIYAKLNIIDRKVALELDKINGDPKTDAVVLNTLTGLYVERIGLKEILRDYIESRQDRI